MSNWTKSVVYWARDKFILNKVGKWSKNLPSLSQYSFFGFQNPWWIPWLPLTWSMWGNGPLYLKSWTSQLTTSLLIFRAYILSQEELSQTGDIDRPPYPFLRLEQNRGSVESTRWWAEDSSQYTPDPKHHLYVPLYCILESGTLAKCPLGPLWDGGAEEPKFLFSEDEVLLELRNLIVYCIIVVLYLEPKSLFLKNLHKSSMSLMSSFKGLFTDIEILLIIEPNSASLKVHLHPGVKDLAFMYFWWSLCLWLSSILESSFPTWASQIYRGHETGKALWNASDKIKNFLNIRKVEAWAKK